MKSAKSEVFLVNKSNARSMRLPVLLLSFLIHFILLSHSPPRSDCSHYFFRFLRLVLNASQPNNGCIYNLHILRHYPVQSSSGRYLFQSPTELAVPLCSASLQCLSAEPSPWLFSMPYLCPGPSNRCIRSRLKICN